MIDRPPPGTDPNIPLPPTLQYTIRVYFPEGDMSGLDDIAAGVAGGHPSWDEFRDELADAMRCGALTPEVFQQLTDLDDDGEHDPDWDWNELDRELREIWRVLAPGYAFPWDEPGQQPRQLTDHPMPNGISVRLAYTLKRLINKGNPSLLQRAMREGTVPHVPRLLDQAVREGQFTPAAWAFIGYPWGTDPATITAEIVDRDLRRVWDVVYPGQPFPDVQQRS